MIVTWDIGCPPREQLVGIHPTSLVLGTSYHESTPSDSCQMVTIIDHVGSAYHQIWGNIQPLLLRLVTLKDDVLKSLWTGTGVG